MGKTIANVLEALLISLDPKAFQKKSLKSN
jgi:hypothetical protein